MPLNIRAKPAQSKLSAVSKSSGHAAASVLHSRVSRAPKHAKGKTLTSTPGCRSGLEPGSVSGGVPAPSSRPEGPRSLSKSSLKVKQNTASEKTTNYGLGSGSGGKTLSMENIQSLSAAYATSDTTYPTDCDPLEQSGHPKGTLSLGRSTYHSHTGPPAASGSSPNIASSRSPPQPQSRQCGDQSTHNTCSPQQQSARHPHTLQASTFDLHTELRELRRENDHLKREMDGGREERIGDNSSASMWSNSELKQGKGFMPEDRMRGSILKDQYRNHHDQHRDHEEVEIPLTVHELQEEIRAHREMNGRLKHQWYQGNSLLLDEEHRGDHSPGPSPRQSPSHLHSPSLKKSPKPSPSNTMTLLRPQEADIIIHSPAHGCSPVGSAQRVSLTNTLHSGPRKSPNVTHYSSSHGSARAPSPNYQQPCSPCQVPGCDCCSSPPPLDSSAENYFRLQSEHDRQAKELFMLKKTMEEMEKRIDCQKQTLGARDESIQRLLEMLQGQSQNQRGWGQRTGVISAATQEAEAQLENMQTRETTNPPFCFDPDVVWQDTKISSLERNLRDLEDEVQMLKTSGLLHPDDRQDELKQVEVYKSHSKFMKTKERTLSPCVSQSSIRPAPTFLLPSTQPWITEQPEIDHLKQELSKKETEMQTLQTKLETLTNQNSDCKQHIEVLKESLTAKEQRANTLQTEVDALRVRLEEKEQFLTKKTKQLQDLSDEKSTLTGEIRDLKDMLEVKERKVNVLQKKIENLLEQLRDKDKQLAGLRERVQGLQTDSSNTDTALATLEEALSEKERVIENLREQKEREDRMRLEDMELLRKENQELKDRLSTIQPQRPLKTSNQSTSPTPNPTQRTETETASLNGTSRSPDITERLRLLEQEVSRYREESVKSQAEVDRLMAALRDAETDRSFKDKKISDLERQIKSPNIQKQIIPAEMRRDAVPDGHAHPQSLSQLPSQDAMRETAERIGELEKALRESMKTSAHREALWAQEEAARVQAQRQLEELMRALEKTREELDATKMRLSTTQQSLHERDGHLTNLRQERRKQLEEILEMKQQALLAAISEKDANIALLEISASNRKKAQEEVMALKREKDRLMHQLKQQTQNRMKLISDNYEEEPLHPQHHLHHSHHLHSANMHHRSLPRGPPHANHRPHMDQDDEEGIWA
ncbi:ERC protein 2 [Boleophthalmus pectinirostris]|uniref:ERC protein 2 n=1 Tax=Boleophthalmus pectinirostris TaxID=150288 RepID=UPI002430EDDF|nr:ERC protein 2 [Boleophthalmus pectinirostris]